MSYGSFRRPRKISDVNYSTRGTPYVHPFFCVSLRVSVKCVSKSVSVRVCACVYVSVYVSVYVRVKSQGNLRGAQESRPKHGSCKPCSPLKRDASTSPNVSFYLNRTTTLVSNGPVQTPRSTPPWKAKLR